MTKKYKSKIGLELIIPFLAIWISILLLAKDDAAFWTMLIVLFPILLFTIHMFSTTNYIIEGNELIIKSGFLFNRSIDINAINKISKSYSIMSAPATSFDRLEIRFNTYDHVQISPKLRDDFIADIIATNPKVEIILKK
jgi:hypothetical protein